MTRQITTITTTQLLEGANPDIHLLHADVLCTPVGRPFTFAPTNTLYGALESIEDDCEITLTAHQITALFAYGHIKVGDTVICHYDRPTLHNAVERDRAYNAAMVIHEIYLDAIQR